MSVKVWGTTTTPSSSWGATGRSVRIIVCARSQAKAVEALRAAGIHNVSLHEFRNYWQQTFNPVEHVVAVEGAVHWSEEGGRRTEDGYRRVTS